MYENTVKHTVYTVKRVILSNKEWCHNCIEAVSDSSARAKKLDASSHLSCILHIFRSDLCDALCINILIIQEFTICQRGKDGNLTAGILALFACASFKTVSKSAPSVFILSSI